MDEKQRRIDHLKDIADALIESYTHKPDFAGDLVEMVKAITNRIALIKKGEV